MNADLEIKTAEVKQQLRDQTPLEEILAGLRREGYSKMDCVKLLRSATGRPLRDAHVWVHASDAWADVRERDERIQNEFLDYLEQSGAKPGSPEQD